MRLSEHVHLNPGEKGSRLLELSGTLPKEQCWLTPGPDLPDNVYLSEGSCLMTGKRVIAELTSLADCQLGPAHRIAEQRPLTGKEHALLKKVGLHSMLKDRFAALGMCHHEANARLRGETAPRLTENFLATSYKTRGKKERQEELFPNLVKEANDRRQNLHSGGFHPDQDAPSYKEMCQNAAKQNLGSQLTPSQVSRFLTKVVAAFSCVLWMDGCHAIRVEGFDVEIKLKDGSVPKIQQPFPLSRFVQLRFELNENEEVALGKARWASPGENSEWNSPSLRGGSIQQRSSGTPGA